MDRLTGVHATHIKVAWKSQSEAYGIEVLMYIFYEFFSGTKWIQVLMSRVRITPEVLFSVSHRILLLAPQ